MRIEVTRSEAITALLSGALVWFGPAGNPALACGYELDVRKPHSRRAAAKWPNNFRYLAPRGTKWAWWITK